MNSYKWPIKGANVHGTLENAIGCPFCPKRFMLLHAANRHVVRNHRDRIETDYDPKMDTWTYWRIK